MKLALVHDWLKDLSGAERVLFELHAMYPQAPIYTLFYNKKFAKKWIPGADIRASFLQKIPFISKLYTSFAWLMPAAIESLDLSQFDTVLSSSAIFSKGLVLRPSTRHICYCYSPTRQIWDNKKSGSGLAKHLLRLWDRPAAERPTEFVAISQTVADRIKKYYRRDAKIIYPPVNLQLSIYNSQSIHNDSIAQLQHSLKISGDFYLIVARLYPHKNIDVAIQAFNKIGYPLVIIGEGPEGKKLQRMAGQNIKFLGYQSDGVISQYYASCRAFIMPQEEDFGLTPIEAMSYGKPVVALRRGGATETVLEGVTGEFFDDPIPEGLADAIRRMNDNYANYNPAIIKAQATRFSPYIFRQKIQEVLK